MMPVMATTALTAASPSASAIALNPTPPLEEFGEMRGIKMRSTTTARSCFARDAKQMRQGTTKNDTMDYMSEETTDLENEII
jgi:hypothetical protein